MGFSLSTAGGDTVRRASGTVATQLGMKFQEVAKHGVATDENVAKQLGHRTPDGQARASTAELAVAKCRIAPAFSTFAIGM
jgi:hypothetical protein